MLTDAIKNEIFFKLLIFRNFNKIIFRTNFNNMKLHFKNNIKRDNK